VGQAGLTKSPPRGTSIFSLWASNSVPMPAVG